MSYRFAIAPLALAGVLVLGRNAGAQDSVATKPLIDHTFTIPVGERVVVFLAKNSRYRAEIDRSATRLQIRVLNGKALPPRIEEFLPGTSAAGSSYYTITPFGDAQYEIRTIGGDPARPIKLRLYLVKPEKPAKDSASLPHTA